MSGTDPAESLQNAKRRSERRSSGNFAHQIVYVLRHSSALQIFGVCLVVIAVVFLVGLVDALLIDAFLVDAHTGQSESGGSDALFQLGIHGVAAIAGAIVGGFLLLAVALAWIWYKD